MDQHTTAYHEAGHAIAAAVSGGQVVRVSIEPDIDGRDGDTQVKWPIEFTNGPASAAKTKTHALREIQVSLAGPVSEMIFQGEYDGLRIKQEHAFDWETAVANAERIESSRDKQIALLSREASRLNDYFRKETTWAAIAELADQLLAHGTIEQETVDTVVNQWLVD